MAGLKDLTGQRFGALVVLSRVPGAKRTTWRCRCDCGRETDVLSTNLLCGRTTSCGCGMHRAAVIRAKDQTRAVDIAGQRFGALVAQHYDKRRHRWLCECDCGGTCWCNITELSSGLRRDCGHAAAAAARDRILAGGAGLHDGTNTQLIKHIVAGKLRATNTSGVTGVRIRYTQAAAVYEARIVVRGKTIYLGRFATLGEAREARRAAEQKYFAPLIADADEKQSREKTGGKA